MVKKMKDKIIVLIAVGTLCLAGAVVAHSFEEPNKIDQLGKRPDHNLIPENRQPPSDTMAIPPIINITDLIGILEMNNQSFYLGDTKLSIGPDEIITKRTAHFDYDGDEIIETIFKEMNGLTGSMVSIRGHVNEVNCFIVFDINDLPIGVTPPHPHQIYPDREPFRNQDLITEYPINRGDIR